MIESKNPILLNGVLQGRQASWPGDAPQRRSYPQLAKPYLNSFLPRFTPAPQICNGNYSMEKIAGDLGSDGVTFQAWLRKNGCRSLKRTGGGARPPFRPKLSQRHICINFFFGKKVRNFYSVNDGVIFWSYLLSNGNNIQYVKNKTRYWSSAITYAHT